MSVLVFRSCCKNFRSAIHRLTTLVILLSKFWLTLSLSINSKPCFITVLSKICIFPIPPNVSNDIPDHTASYSRGEHLNCHHYRNFRFCTVQPWFINRSISGWTVIFFHNNLPKSWKEILTGNMKLFSFVWSDGY